ncbi:MAG: regulatory protein RecX [Kocuria rhizophila]|uniref:regulatory protein RecX n=1 Tax=Kocuria salsicia TaxID=664639 RepID=UPI001EC8B2F4|nr:regulatory protein RecX [Kocuria rhizophila]
MSDSSRYDARRRRATASRRGPAAASASRSAADSTPSGNALPESASSGHALFAVPPVAQHHAEPGEGPALVPEGGSETSTGEAHGGEDLGVRERARSIVLRQLTASAKSRRQLEDKLADKDIPDDVAGEVLDRLEEVNLVDDRAFAAMFVRSRAETRRLSRSALRRELSHRGIIGEIAEQALDQRSDEDELRDAHELVRKKLPATLDPSDRKEYEKLTRRLVSMLGRKGYAPGLAFAVVKEELADLGSAGAGEERPDLDGADVWDTP